MADTGYIQRGLQGCKMVRGDSLISDNGNTGTGKHAGNFHPGPGNEPLSDQYVIGAIAQGNGDNDRFAHDRKSLTAAWTGIMAASASMTSPAMTSFFSSREITVMSASP